MRKRREKQDARGVKKGLQKEWKKKDIIPSLHNDQEPLNSTPSLVLTSILIHIFPEIQLGNETK